MLLEILGYVGLVVHSSCSSSSSCFSKTSSCFSVLKKILRFKFEKDKELSPRSNLLLGLDRQSAAGFRDSSEAGQLFSKVYYEEFCPSDAGRALNNRLLLLQ